MAVRLWSVLPKDNDANGLVVLEKALLADPDEEHVIICRVNRKRVTTDDDSHETIPTIRVLHAEVMEDAQAADHARTLMRRQLKERTGQDTLPFPGED